MESQMSMLKENLESQGIKVDAVEITVQSHAFEGGQNLQGNNSQQEKAGKEGKRHLDLSSLDELSDDELSEDEAAAKNAVMTAPILFGDSIPRIALTKPYAKETI